MPHLLVRTRSLKRFFSFSIHGRRSRSEEEEPEKKNSISSPLRNGLEPSFVDDSPQKSTWRCFSYEEIHEATDGFDPGNFVGRGGYAEVFRGVLHDGRKIAVKRLTRASTDEQKAKEFLTELGTVGHVQHPNVSTLLGCCIDNDLHLIFEFFTNGPVSYHLHDENMPPMPWKFRHKIAIGTAKGLHYLHKGCKRRIIHRDIKTSNVLLTSDYDPQISDFGLARWLPSEWSHRAVAPIEGTFGCLAPEYFTQGIVDEKTDVFAYGVFLLEIISGRKPVDGSHKSLLGWAKPYLSDCTVEMLVDPRLRKEYELEQLRKLAFAASLCIKPIAMCRPSMTEVLELLEDGEASAACWIKLPEEDVDEEDSWGFDDLNEECDTPWSPSSSETSQLQPSS